MTSAQRAQCDVLKYLQVTTSSGYLASIEAEEHDYGTVACPWLLHGSPGQTISLSLLNFAQRPEHATQKGGCYELAVIYEGSESRSITTCDGADGERRGSVIFKSVTNEVRLQMVSKEALKTLGKFLVKYKGGYRSAMSFPSIACHFTKLGDQSFMEWLNNLLVLALLKGRPCYVSCQ